MNSTIKNHSPLKGDLQDYLSVLGADTYTLQLVHPDKAAIRQTKLFESDMLKRKGFMFYRNNDGYHIYARPDGNQFVLVDDLTRDKLKAFSELRPCLLIETSPDNFQAWLKLDFVPSDEHALAICRGVAIRFDADLGSAEPKHVGRLPTYQNQKLKYSRQDGTFPMVTLWRWANRYSTIQPQDFESVPIVSPQSGGCGSYKKEVRNGDRSAFDFALACKLLEQGRDETFILDELRRLSDKFREKGNHGERYIEQTVRNAARKMSI